MSKNNVTNIIVAGVGGQGSILTSYLLTQAALKAGSDVKVAETFGAATRGGSVMAHIRIGAAWAPLITEDEADIILALEPLEGLREATQYLKPGGWIILNTFPWLPVDVNTGRAIYPSENDMVEALKALGANVIRFNATQAAIELGDSRVLNSVMLGCLFALQLVDIDEDFLIEAMQERWNEKLVSLNQAAFLKGKLLVEQSASENLPAK